MTIAWASAAANACRRVIALEGAFGMAAFGTAVSGKPFSISESPRVGLLVHPLHDPRPADEVLLHAVIPFHGLVSR